MIRHGTSWVTVNSATSPSLNQWYCVEPQWQKSPTAGLGKLYVNGVLVCSLTDKNTAAYGDINQVRFGLPQINNCGPTTANCDCAKIASTYIGPETYCARVVSSLSSLSYDVRWKYIGSLQFISPI